MTNDLILAAFSSSSPLPFIPSPCIATVRPVYTAHPRRPATISTTATTAFPWDELPTPTMDKQRSSSLCLAMLPRLLRRLRTRPRRRSRARSRSSLSTVSSSRSTSGSHSSSHRSRSVRWATPLGYQAGRLGHRRRRTQAATRRRGILWNTSSSIDAFHVIWREIWVSVELRTV